MFDSSQNWKRLIFGLLVIVSCSKTEPETEPPPPQEKPNNVLVVVDTLRADHLGVYGHHRATSPTMDELARTGTWFGRAYAHSGWTLASMTSLFTGLHFHKHRVGRAPNDPAQFGRLPDETETLAELLGGAGYATAGVVNNTFLAPEFGLNQGFGENYLWDGASNIQHRTGVETVDLGLDWLKAQTSPSFLFLHMMEPHLSYDPPESIRGTFAPKEGLPFRVPLLQQDLLDGINTGRLTLDEDLINAVTGLYDEEILAADQAIGELVKGLKAQGVWENTLIVITSDHGEEFWDHGGFEHGHTLYGELTRVPLILSGGALSNPVGRVDTLTAHVDVFRGLVERVGATVPAGVAGLDMFEIANGLSVPGRAILSENTLYGPSLVSVVDDGNRLVINQHSAAGEVWAVDSMGLELERRQGRDQMEHGQRLTNILAQMRGTLDPVESVVGPQIPSPDTFEQLRALGYLNE